MRSLNTSPQLVIEISAGSPAAKALDGSSLAPAGVAAIVAIVSWIVVERFARRRERRSDMRELVKAFGAAVDDIVGSAHEFYRLGGRDARAQMLAASIRANLGSLPRLLEVLRKGRSTLDVKDQLRLFRQAVTGGGFDESARMPSPDADEIYARITAAGRALATEVQISFFGKLI